MVGGSLTIDTFSFTKTGESSSVAISSLDIAWPDDKKYKFKNLADKSTKQWIDVEDERFIVWMRAAATPTFRKLWGKIESGSLPLKKGSYEVTITNRTSISLIIFSLECK